MQEENPHGFLGRIGVEYKERGNQLIANCPLCGKKDKFYMNSSNGAWDCKVCQEHGNIYQLRGMLAVDTIRPMAEPKPSQMKKDPVAKSIVDSMHKALLEDKEAMEYLTELRSYTIEAIKMMKLGLKNQNGKWISYPWFSGGECRGCKFRAIKPKDKDHRFQRQPGYESILYNVDSLNSEDDKTILTSGEPDAVALISMGFKSVVATTTGESSMPEDSIVLLKKKKIVFLLYDNDEAGMKGCVKVAKRIGDDLVRIIKLPDECNDANDFLILHQGKAREELEKLMRNAVQAPIPSVHRVSDVIDRIHEVNRKKDPKEKINETPWDNINEMISKLSGFVIVSAPQGTGKTTFTLNIADHWARILHKPTLLYCLEMTPEELVKKILAASYEKTIEELEERWIEEHWGNACQDYNQCQLYIGSSFRLRKSDEILALLRAAIVRFELELVVFDNIHIIGRGRNQKDELGTFALGLKDMSTEFEIPIITIAQPRKLEPGVIMTPWDIKDSNDIFSDADQMIILHRQQLAAEKDSAELNDVPVMNPLTLVRLAKARFALPKDSWLYCEGAQHRFRELIHGETYEVKTKAGIKTNRWGGHMGASAEPFE